MCRRIIDSAEAHANLRGGWTTSRHYSVPTTDLPLTSVPELKDIFNALLMDKLASILSTLFCGDIISEYLECDVSVHDVFVVKYSQPIIDTDVTRMCVHGCNLVTNRCDDVEDATVAASQRYLPLHMDESTHSFVIALNDSCEYVGGGTYFVDLGRAIKPGEIRMMKFG